MKYLQNISIPSISSGLTSESHRGEGRWERNVLNALLTNGKTVHTTRHIWDAPEPRPANLYDGLNEAWMHESVLLVHGAGRSLYIERDDARAYIVHFYETPFGQAADDFKRYLSQGRIVATVCTFNPYIYNKLAQPFGAQNVYRTPGPTVPYTVDDADNFRKPNVTWIYRNFREFLEDKPGEIATLFRFLAPVLQKEPDMRVSIVIGLWDSVRFGTSPSIDELREWALGFPVMNEFKHLFDRIDFYVSVHWKDILALLSETRWIISPAEPAAAPVYEAAMFGIPTIVNNGISPLMTLTGGTLFPEVLTAPRQINAPFLNTLDKLQNDHAFYRKAGDAYRKYVKENATFKVYTEQLDKIVQERGWDK